MQTEKLFNTVLEKASDLHIYRHRTKIHEIDNLIWIPSDSLNLHKQRISKSIKYYKDDSVVYSE